MVLGHVVAAFGDSWFVLPWHLVVLDHVATVFGGS